MRQITLSGGVSVPALGLGTWRYGEAARTRTAEVAALRRALELGYRLIDSAEMYGDGGAEEAVGSAIDDAVRAGDVRREELFIVTKVLPQNASRTDTARACERSLKRLQLDRIDLYLLHWRGSHPVAETVQAFESLRAAGRIRHWGVSNFDVADMTALWKVADGSNCVANQVYFSLSERGIEFDLAPWQRERAVPLMAYCPIDQGVLARSAALRPIAARLNATPAQLALAWLMQRGDTIAIPKAVRESHLQENIAAASLALDASMLGEIDAVFPPPRSKKPLAMT